MSFDDRRAVETAVARSAALREDLAALARLTAETAEQGARVHDEMADAHAQLATPQLDPEDLRRHADVDRGFAAHERRQADELERPPG